MARRRRRTVTGAALGLGLVVLVSLLALWRGLAYLHGPLGIELPTPITVERGATLRPVLAELERSGVVTHPDWLYTYARITGATTIRAGEYVAAPGDSPARLLAKLAEGKVRTEQFAVIEGQNRWTVRDALAQARWMAAAEFERLCDDAAFLAKNGIPGPSCEGYLFPDTYTFARGLAPEAILTAMFAMFHEVHREITAGGRGPMGLDMRELATLASIIEKETGAPEERPRVACVFYNRLRAKPAWRLDTDPTVIYAATLTDPKFDGNLKASHLRQLDHPYNTYRRHGLPPGPIANAGRAAFLAAVKPAECNDYFFVSKNNGTHVFCPTLDCHNKAVQELQIDYFRKRRRGR